MLPYDSSGGPVKSVWRVPWSDLNPHLIPSRLLMFSKCKQLLTYCPIIHMSQPLAFMLLQWLIIPTGFLRMLSYHHGVEVRGHYVYFAMRWGTASKEASRRRTTPKQGSSLSGHWMGHLFSYSLSGGHDGTILPINPRGLNGSLTSHFIFSSHMYFSLNTPTHYWSPMPNKSNEWLNDYNTPTLSWVMIEWFSKFH